MNEKQPVAMETIPCEICLSEIPDAQNPNAEFDTYVSNYCGLECYQQWRDRQVANELVQKEN